MKNSIRNRFLSMLLVLTMMFSFCPAAFAGADNEPEEASYEDQLGSDAFDSETVDEPEEPDDVPDPEPAYDLGPADDANPDEGDEPASEPDSKVDWKTRPYCGHGLLSLRRNTGRL